METSTLSESRPAVRPGTEEHRRAARMRKVRPIAFVPRSPGAAPAMQTVTANVSRGGMLLVTRQDHFPPAGAAVLLMPFEAAGGSTPDSHAAIEGRIVYTRFSPRAKLRFAGLKFEQDLPERAARMLGLDGTPDTVTDAITTLEELEANAIRTGTIAEAEIFAIPQAIEETDYPVVRPIDDANTAPAEFAAAQRDFMLATAASLSEWGEERIRKSISDRHALARAKGAGGLRAMKAEWTDLRGRFRDMTSEAIDLYAIAERNPIAEPFYNHEQDQPRAEIMHALRALAGHIGRILIRHGFDDIGDGSDWTLLSGQSGAIAFRGPMDYSEAMREALLRAERACADIAREREQTGAAREQTARAEALALWDRA